MAELERVNVDGDWVTRPAVAVGGLRVVNLAAGETWSFDELAPNEVILVLSTVAGGPSTAFYAKAGDGSSLDGPVLDGFVLD